MHAHGYLTHATSLHFAQKEHGLLQLALVDHVRRRDGLVLLSRDAAAQKQDGDEGFRSYTSQPIEHATLAELTRQIKAFYFPLIRRTFGREPAFVRITPPVNVMAHGHVRPINFITEPHEYAHFRSYLLRHPRAPPEERMLYVELLLPSPPPWSRLLKAFVTADPS